MRRTSAENAVRELLAAADIEVGGSRPWDIEIHDKAVYGRLLGHASIGLGETYMSCGWDSESVDEMVCRLIRSGIEERVRKSPRLMLQVLRNRLTNPQTVRRSLEVGRRHYDIGNDLYAAMLDGEMTYTCGYWKDASTLDDAQQAKLGLVCEKIGLKPGMRVLDIGCGWGAFARHAAGHFGAEVVGITISRRQAEMAAERCSGLPVEIRFQDYRRVREKFDRVVSLGMFEHVGSKNYGEYMRRTHDCLKDGGISMLHTITANAAQAGVDPWIEKYIFPRGQLPSLKEIFAAAEEFFVVEDCHNLSTDYDRTLMAWHRNFNSGWSALKGSYDDSFRRMWNFYLLSCAGTFRAREIQVWQIVLSKGGVPGGYRSIR